MKHCHLHVHCTLDKKIHTFGSKHSFLHRLLDTSVLLPHTKTAWSANSAAVGDTTTGNATMVTTAETGPTETVTASITAAIAANVWRTVVCVRNVNSAWSAVFARIDAVGVKNMAKPSVRTVVKNALAAAGSAANVRNALTA